MKLESYFAVNAFTIMLQNRCYILFIRRLDAIKGC